MADGLRSSNGLENRRLKRLVASRVHRGSLGGSRKISHPRLHDSAPLRMAVLAAMSLRVQAPHPRATLYFDTRIA